MAVAFSSSDEDVLHRKTEVVCSDEMTASGNLADLYQIEDCKIWIQDNGYKTVALQFPDSLISGASHVYTALCALCKVYILADTSYSSCCVDEVAAAHVSSDAIIHFGHSCHSLTSTLPVLYVFGKYNINVVECRNAFISLYPDKQEKVCICFDTCYSHAIGDLRHSLAEYSSVRFITTKPEDKATVDSVCDSEYLKDSQLFYIGQDTVALPNLMLMYGHCRVSSYNPQTKKMQHTNDNIQKLLMRRYYMVERTKDAHIVGILVGTLGVAKYKEMIARVKQLAKIAGKSTYIFLVGKINPAKLANFAEVDVFVIVGCPESTLLNSKEYYKPLVTPFEFEIACNKARDWTGDYEMKFNELLPGGDKYVEAPADFTTETDVSLVTAKMRNFGNHPDTDVAAAREGSLVKRDKYTVSDAFASGDFFGDRSFRGLEQNLGQTEVQLAKEGSAGIAMQYNTEPDLKS